MGYICADSAADSGKGHLFKPDLSVNGQRMMDGGNQGYAEVLYQQEPVSQTLVIVNDIVRFPLEEFAQLEISPKTKGLNFREHPET